jgi:L-aspartate oxidase
MVQVAHCVAEAALWRENSVGAHFRGDFPEAKRAGWKQHSQLALQESPTEPKRVGKPGLVVAMQVQRPRSRARSSSGRS